MNKIAILGGGESGVGAALLAKAKGFEVFLSEASRIDEVRKGMLEENGIGYEEGGHTLEKIFDSLEVIKSPGIPYSAEVVVAIQQKGIAIIDELEFASRYTQGKIIAITGTNGKTTTTLLTYQLMVEAGLDVGLAGNIGESWAGQLVSRDHAWWVLEVSSFQIDGFKTIKPHVAIILNITPDHLDRYDYSFEKYMFSKLHLLKNMDSEDHFIFYKEDEHLWKGLNEISVLPSVHEVSLKRIVDNGSYFDGTSVHVKNGGETVSIASNDIALRGNHNMINVMSAMTAAMIAGAGKDGVQKGLQEFKNAPHRMEKVTEIDGVLYINDSKGTNVDATYYALSSFGERKIIWIAGGVDKGNDYTQLYPLIENRIKALICLSKDCDKLTAAFNGRIADISTTQQVSEAVEMASAKAQNGDVVLFSPACSSFDLFKNYVDRGEQFIRAVNGLVKEK
ncbi:UDP-N-acetylmuramoylalanine--D-glutamate ligase [Anditalea andensis]|uniref:UDP-N-acetylmuramoylalanine--D-glutamate ligase n=2 Tax=Anditalea andensis TaxID=1048983 RepID=A0A074L1U9_9BACT|nr:UDP-N-acetylmuramoylalanine--D-glutamate ligase [Anditalea andensis]